MDKHVYCFSNLICSIVSPATAIGETKNTANEPLFKETIIIEADKVAEYSVTFNEYEMLETLSKQSNKELTKYGFDKNEIESIRNYKQEFRKHIENLNSTYNDEELLLLDYTKEDIEIIRNYATKGGGNDSQLAANLTVYLRNSTITYNGGINKLQLSCDFVWKKTPTVLLSDKFAVSWGSPFIIDTNIHGNGFVPLMATYGPVYQTESIRGERVAQQGIVYDVPLTRGVQQSVLREGNMSLTLRYNGPQINETQVAVEYVHKRTPGSIGYTLGANGLGVSWAPTALTHWVGIIKNIGRT
jgi:hypothetical protein